MLAPTLIAWQKTAGRNNLPWQHPITPYRTWISEIMLQQTQVATVIPYFEQFMASFPTVAGLAAANQERVLEHWSGLGYYARARNLHKAAQIMTSEHAGKVPSDFEALVGLPGIGRSTAGAILSIAYQLPFPILDGNAKRVLLRYHGIGAAPDLTQTLNQLWALAEQHTPEEKVATYTQAMMDLGSMLCTRSKPNCGDCPLQHDCQAYQVGKTDQIPAKRAKKRAIPTKHCQMLILQHQSELLLVKRPNKGIWGGLWCFPQYDDPEVDLITEATAYFTDLSPAKLQKTRLDSFKHTFTHFHLKIQPILINVPKGHQRARIGVWHAFEVINDLAIPKPVGSVLESTLRLRV